MENLIFFLATSFGLRLSSSKKIKKYFIADTGCSALLFSGNNFGQSITSSGDKLYFNKFSAKGITYGVICIQLKNNYEKKEATLLLEDYMNKLKSSFHIYYNTGVQDCVDWNTSNSKTLIDYWQGADKKDWKVKGYTNGKIMAVLYVKNINNVEVKKQDLFLDSFHFRGSM